jgi:23S rRNA (uridine2552-2'-O)-methyltransferase
VAVDLLEIAPMSGVMVLRGDFRDPPVQVQVTAALAGEKADVVLSDMSPNISGIASADQARAAELVRIAMQFCQQQMKAQGAFLVKVFQGEEFVELLKEMKQVFVEVKTVKPSASREESRETYLLARGLKGIQ